MVGSKVGPLHRGADGAYDQHRNWRPALQLLPDDQRAMPDTVPHEWVFSHRLNCECLPCQRHPNQRMLRDGKLRFRRAARRRA